MPPSGGFLLRGKDMLDTYLRFKLTASIVIACIAGAVLLAMIIILIIKRRR